MRLLTGDLGVGLLVLARVMAMMQVAPLFSSAVIPGPARIGLALFIAMIALPGVLAGGYPVPASGMQFALLLIGEALVGVLLGFLVFLGFAALQTAGQFISLPVGFGIVELLDPVTEGRTPLLGGLFHVLALLAFLSVGGLHRLMLDGVAGSFHALRAADLVVSFEAGTGAGAGLLLQTVAGSLTRLFGTAMTIALPIFAALLLVSLALAMLARVAPHMNLLMLGLPLSLGAGLVILLVALPLLLSAASGALDDGFATLRRVLVGVPEALPGAQSSGAPAGTGAVP